MLCPEEAKRRAKGPVLFRWTRLRARTLRKSYRFRPEKTHWPTLRECYMNPMRPPSTQINHTDHENAHLDESPAIPTGKSFQSDNGKLGVATRPE